MPSVRREALEALVLLSAPMMPHLAETCWEALGHTKLVAETPWPKHDPALTAYRTASPSRCRSTASAAAKFDDGARCRQQASWKPLRWRWRA